jgi:hypothetical protein
MMVVDPTPAITLESDILAYDFGMRSGTNLKV